MKLLLMCWQFPWGRKQMSRTSAVCTIQDNVVCECMNMLKLCFRTCMLVTLHTGCGIAGAGNCMQAISWASAERWSIPILHPRSIPILWSLCHKQKIERLLLPCEQIQLLLKLLMLNVQLQMYVPHELNSHNMQFSFSDYILAGHLDKSSSVHCLADLYCTLWKIRKHGILQKITD